MFQTYESGTLRAITFEEKLDSLFMSYEITIKLFPSKLFQNS
jgi:hypothetical protein